MIIFLWRMKIITAKAYVSWLNYHAADRLAKIDK